MPQFFNNFFFFPCCVCVCVCTCCTMYVLRTSYPTNNTPLINFRQSSDAEIFVTKHRLSMQVGAKMRKKNRVRNVYTFQLSFIFAYHRWWLGRAGREERVEYNGPFIQKRLLRGPATVSGERGGYSSTTPSPSSTHPPIPSLE